MIEAAQRPEKARVLIAGSMADAASYAAARIDEIDRAIAAWEDGIATAQDNLALGMDTVARIDQRIAAIEADENATVRDAAARMRDIDAEVGDLQSRRREIEGYPAQTDARIATYHERQATLEGILDQVGDATEGWRGFGGGYGRQDANAETEMREIADVVLPALIEARDNWAAEIVAIDARLAELRAEATEWQRIIDLGGATRETAAEALQAQDERDVWQQSMAEQRAYIEGAQTAVADLRSERDDLARIDGVSA